jgi:hypothetical protein
MILIASYGLPFLRILFSGDRVLWDDERSVFEGQLNIDLHPKAMRIAQEFIPSSCFPNHPVPIPRLMRRLLERNLLTSISVVSRLKTLMEETFSSESSVHATSSNFTMPGRCEMTNCGSETFGGYCTSVSCLPRALKRWNRKCYFLVNCDSISTHVHSYRNPYPLLPPFFHMNEIESCIAIKSASPTKMARIVGIV